MKPYVLFRKNLDEYSSDLNDEFDICSKYFSTTEYRTQIPDNSYVFGRFSVLPFYEELEKELIDKKCKLVNTYHQHRYIADIMNYYEDLKKYTPATYTEWGGLPEGSYIVKGRTNSRKFQWDTHMFAKDKKSIVDVVRRVLDDGLINSQGVIVREYVPLKKLDEGINGLPITNEWRFFFYGKTLLAKGFYWSSCPEVFDQAECTDEMIKMAKEIAVIVSKKANFFVLDMAEKAVKGKTGCILVEVNDGSMSGTSMCEPEELYCNLLNAFMRKLL